MMVGVGRDSKLNDKKVRKICNLVKDMAVARITSLENPKVSWDGLLEQVNKFICVDEKIQDRKTLMRHPLIKEAFDQAKSMQRAHSYMNVGPRKYERMSREELLTFISNQESEINYLNNRLSQLADSKYIKLLALATAPVGFGQVIALKNIDQNYD